MAKAKQRPVNTLQLKTLAIVALGEYIRSVNTPCNISNFTRAFLILVLFLTIPLLVIGTINQRDLRSAAKIQRCPTLSSLSDQSPPSVTIENPSEGNYLTGKNFMIKVAAADNICVQKVSLLIDGQIVKNFNTTPYIYSWDLRSVAAGNHVISARVYDTSGNIAAASVSVFRSAKSFVRP